MRLGVAIAGGVVGGASGAGCMTVLRLAARRAGWIDLMPPQATARWLEARTGTARHGAGAHHLVDALVHWLVAMAGGAVYGGLVREPAAARLGGGALFGLGLWAVAFGALLPALGVTRPLTRSARPAVAVNVLSHVLYGIATALVTAELSRQARGTGGARGARARVG